MGMDVWLHGSGLVVLWVIAGLLALLVVLVWALLVQVLGLRRRLAPDAPRPGRVESAAR